jgi:cytosine/adenosine deaminase-related metal-dependent hydrolase
MLTRRIFGALLGGTAMTGLAAPAQIHRSFAQGSAPTVARGNYLIKYGAVITVDPTMGVLARGDVHVNNGRIEAIGPNLTVAEAEIIDATDMIVMPGFVETHHHMWSSIGRNFTGDAGFGYFPAKAATSKLYEPVDFYRSVTLGLVECANAGITTVHNWSHNTRTPAHADAELQAHRESMLRARYSYGHVDQMPATSL